MPTWRPKNTKSNRIIYKDNNTPYIVKRGGVEDPYKEEVVESGIILPDVVARPTQNTWNYIKDFQKDVPNKSIRNTMALLANKSWTREPQQNIISKIREIYDNAGKPKIRNIQNSALTIYGELTGDKKQVGRPYYQPIPNTMYLPRIKSPYCPAYNPKSFIKELSHPYLNNLVGLVEGAIGLPSDFKVNGKNGYNRPDHFEYKTHRIVEPLLNSYILGAGRILSAPTTLQETNNKILNRLNKIDK